MTSNLVDSNVILDVLSSGQTWSKWSAGKLAEAANAGDVVIDSLIYAEVSVQFRVQAELDRFLARTGLIREDAPWDAAFLAGRADAQYRRQGGIRERTLPDFFICAHAFVRGRRLLTRDPSRCRTYFPTVQLIAPDSHP